jgi:flavin-dependent dehydrogenase
MSSPPIPRSTQVLVVGGGPAGSATAWYCAQAGLDVVLIDRARFPRAKPCAEYVSPEGARILSAMGALETLDAQAAALTGMVVHAPSGEQIHGEFVARHAFRGFRDRGLGIRREVLDTLLLGRARAAGVQVIEGLKVEDVLRDASGRASGVRVRCDAEHDRSGGADRAAAVRTIDAALIVGADGLRSVVARRLGLAHSARWPKRFAIVAHYRGVAGMSSLGEMFVTPDGYVGLAHVGDDVTNVALVVPARSAANIDGDPEAFLTAWLAKHHDLGARFKTATRVSPVRVTGPFASRATRAFAPGVALVGDAADFFDPFTGEGIYAALRGGELLAPFVVDAVAARARGDASAERQSLRAYGRARHTTFAGKWRVEKLIGAAVAVPALMNGAARVLGRDRDLSDLLIGVTGDFVPPGVIVTPRTLLRFAAAVGRTVAGTWFPGSPSHRLTPPRSSSPSPNSPPHVHRS